MFKWLKSFQFKRISVMELDDYLKTEGEKVLIDIKSKYEYKKSHIKGFKNIPLEKLLKRIDELPLEKEIIIIGKNKLHGASACRFLKKIGYKKIALVINE